VAIMRDDILRIAAAVNSGLGLTEGIAPFQRDLKLGLPLKDRSSAWRRRSPPRGETTWLEIEMVDIVVAPASESATDRRLRRKMCTKRRLHRMALRAGM
jgi:hypothetical protein